MNKTISFILSLIILVLCVSLNSQGQSIEQRLVIVQNDQTLGGNFRIQVQVKGTNLPAANTVGSATIDVQFNNTHLTYVNATLPGGPTIPLGYNRNVQNIGTYIRIGITGGNIGPSNELDGYDIGTTYVSWAQLNFTIQALTTTSLTIKDSTNAIGLFENHANNPETGIINNQPLTAPINIIDAPLPVELTSFTSKFLNDKVQLNWVTKTEVNNYGFNVERRINESEWKNIGFVEGHGNSNSPKQYSYTDKDLFAGGSKFQYRLKQVDTDGSFEYSDVVEVEIVPTKFELSQNYPNPFNPSTTIRFSLPKETSLKINIYNMLGELVDVLAEDTYEAGYHKVTFNASSLPSGVYIYRLEGADPSPGSGQSFVQVRKMVLIK